MTTDKQNIQNLKSKINYINSYGFENLIKFIIKKY